MNDSEINRYTDGREPLSGGSLSVGPFSRLAPIAAPETVRTAVHARIRVAERRSTRAWMATLAALAAVSLTTVIASVQSVWTSLSASGAVQFISLAFTDGSAALRYSRDLGLVLLESLPAAGIAAIIASLIALGWSVSKLMSRRTAGIPSMPAFIIA